MSRSTPASLFVHAIRLVVPAGIIILAALWFIGSQLFQGALEIELNRHVDEIGEREQGRIQDRLDNLQTFARSLARNKLLVNGLIDMEGREGYLPAFIRSLAPPAGAFAEISVADYKGRIIVSNTDDPAPVADMKGLKDGGRLILGLDGLTVVEPISYSNSVEGAFVLRYMPEALDNLIGARRVGSSFYIASEDGVVIYSSNQELAVPGIPVPADSLEGWIKTGAPLAGGELSVTVASSIEDVSRPLVVLENLQLAGMVLFLLVATSLAVASAFIVSRPLNEFTSRISSIQDLDSLHQPLEVQGAKEIQKLAAAFNGMAVKLEASVRNERQLQNDLREAQKLEAVGQLAGGIAHEINTPSQYIGDNLRFLSDACGDLFSLIDAGTTLAESVRTGQDPAGPADRFFETGEDIDLEYLREETPSAIDQSLSAITQVSRIVLAMKEFSHPGTKEKSLSDINRALENTLTISRNEWKHVAEVETDFDETLSAVPCHIGEMNQVFLNLIVNAAHAIEAHGHSPADGRIVLSTSRDETDLFVRIQDNGSGIPEELQDKIFNPFFTTKDVGQGTGQGLAIARDIIVAKHGGDISFVSEPGKGTTFVIRIPLSAEHPGNGQHQTPETVV